MNISNNLLKISIIPVGIGTALATLLTNPLDMLKTRLQSGLEYHT